MLFYDFFDQKLKKKKRKKERKKNTCFSGSPSLFANCLLTVPYRIAIVNASLETFAESFKF